MKYIRTKDTIYEIDKDISFGGREIYKVRNHDFSIIGNGLSKADTIEELCDVFVEEVPIYKGNDVAEIDHQIWLFNKERNRFEDDFSELEHEDFISDKYNFYGAIWTNKGLIYVAKMNKDGDFELL